MDEWNDLDEIFVATLRGRRHGIGFMSVSSSIQSKGQDTSDIDMVLTEDTPDLGEAIEIYSICSSGQKRQVDEDPTSDDVHAHERAKKKQRSWSHKQNAKAKMHAWEKAAGQELPTNNNTTIPHAHIRQ